MNWEQLKELDLHKQYTQHKYNTTKQAWSNQLLSCNYLQDLVKHLTYLNYDPFFDDDSVNYVVSLTTLCVLWERQRVYSFLTTDGDREQE